MEFWRYLICDRRGAQHPGLLGRLHGRRVDRLACAEAYWLQGEPCRAAQEAERADDVAASADGWERGEVAVWLRRTTSDRSPRGELAEPYRLQVAGEWAEAARAWASLGCPYEAALALHDASEEAALRQALQASPRRSADQAR